MSCYHVFFLICPIWFKRILQKLQCNSCETVTYLFINFHCIEVANGHKYKVHALPKKKPQNNVKLILLVVCIFDRGGR